MGIKNDERVKAKKPTSIPNLFYKCSNILFGLLYSIFLISEFDISLGIISIFGTLISFILFIGIGKIIRLLEEIRGWSMCLKFKSLGNKDQQN